MVSKSWKHLSALSYGFMVELTVCVSIARGNQIGCFGGLGRYIFIF